MVIVFDPANSLRAIFTAEFAESAEFSQKRVGALGDLCGKPVGAD
jgi:hypothetical protein